ncbi:unnamed protein product [Parnassius mnemosyne]|uniref:Ankyrin repeat domain-containing protein n=1 Tax=Parnassius mnemosyne TaxID=213953 RepID=A0AAV1KBG0_9NEOP
MPLNADDIAKRYPIHWLVWNNEHEELKNLLEANKFTKEDIELRDPRGRTPLLLAVTLGYIEAVQALIDAGADVNCEKDGWTAVQEATATGDPQLLSLVLSRRDKQRHLARSSGVPELLRRLSLAPDFYVEMKWEFTSWVPLVSRICPFDTYKVYKRGGNVRVDTTLAGFDETHWQRGERTYIFRGQGTRASLVELDHELGTAWSEHMEADAPCAWPPPPRAALQQRLAAPLALNYLDTDKISFERNKSGIWGWRQDKTETVNGYECKVFSANNVELVSKSRSEHLPRGERARAAPRAPLAGLLALADRDAPADTADPDDPDDPEDPEQEDLPRTSRSREDLQPVSWAEYFSDEPLEKDIGRPKEITTKVQKFKATLWLCEDYPLELQEQIMPILDLMTAISSPHFAKLKDFIQMQLPAGFPVKIEIPLFHVVNARITFGNIFATESPVAHISCIREGERLSCVVDDACFEVGRGYRPVVPGVRESSGTDDEDALLQYAIQQSLMEAGTHDDQVDVWEALRGARPSSPASPASPAAPPPRGLLADEERQLQRAIEASLSLSNLGAEAELLSGADAEAGAEAEAEAQAEAELLSGADAEAGAEAEAEAQAEAELRAALALSAREQAERDRRLRDEQHALDEALRLSLIDK